MQDTWVWSLGQEDPPEKGMATHSSILAWRILWTEEPGGLQSPKEPGGLQGPKESNTTERLAFTFIQLYGYATVCLAFHLLKTYLDFSHFQMLQMKHLWIFYAQVFLCVYKVLFLWGKYPVLRLLSCIISICLNFKEISRLIFSQWHYHSLSS